jgi:imidazole glycerol-phosphate synthase subunit HisH
MIGIIDTGTCNLNSIKNIIEKEKKKITIIKSLSQFRNKKIKKVIIPGVGSFAECMKKLRSTKIDKEIVLFSKKNMVLGICVGMQILGTNGYEFKHEKGLNLLNFVVKKMKIKKQYALPHVGWNNVRFKKSILFEGVKQNSNFYFTHSYEVITKDKKIIIGETNYGKKFVSAVSHGNIYGVQFHPEKSSILGTKIIKNFINANA